MEGREKAFSLLNEWVESKSLKKHCLAVAFAMEHYAKLNGLNEEEKNNWFVAGLLHDMDYEKFPELEQHGIETAKVLRENNFPEEISNAIMGHNKHLNTPRNSPIAKTLFAVDELCGLIVALAKVRPEKFVNMTPDSLKKAMRKKGFAAAINREDIMRGIEELGISEEEHFKNTITALSEKAEFL